uniref:Nuclear receptor corepressor 1 n=1 Tax=Davidia involucrata TaxID=16924 RepID=A0A5B7B0R0_DAVIN
MPPEPLPWDRKDFFKDRKHERSSDSLGPVSRWRETSHHGSSSRDFARWGSAEFRSRPPGHGKQGGWHLSSEESSHGFMSSRSNEKILEDESFRLSVSRGDGKYIRNSRENRVSFSQKDCKGHSWESGASPNSSGRLHDVSDQRSVDDMLTYNPRTHSDFVNTWDQLHFKDQHDKCGGVNGLGTGQRFERENSLVSIDWKPLKWTRSGSLSSRGSGFSHSSSSKSIGVDSNEAKAEIQHRNVTPIQSPSGDAVACVTSAAPAEEMSSRKKPRLGWGEGLAKYEKKKVDGPDDGATKNGMVTCGSTEPIHSHVSNLADKSPRVTGFSDCASPATPSSVACSSSPGMEDTQFKAGSIENDNSNIISSPNLTSQNHVEGLAFNLENVELTPITNLSSLLSELLQSDDPSSEDSSFVRSTAMNKLLVWKGDISKALEMTESEIDLLEIELKSLISESGYSCPCPASSSSLPGECQAKPCEEPGAVSNSVPRPAPLQFVSSGDMVVEKVVGALEGAEVKHEDIDSPGTVTSKFVNSVSAVKAASPSDTGKHAECSGDLDASRFRNLEVNCSVYVSSEEKTGVSASGDCTQLTASYSCATPSTDVRLYCDGEDTLYDLILASNKDSANRAIEVFNKLLATDQCRFDISRATSVSCRQNDTLIKEKFAMRKRFLKFKERVISLKFRAFQHLWKEDMRLLSIRKYRAKSHRRFELSSRTTHSGYQKHRSSIRSRFSSPAGNLSLVPTTEIINFTSKLLSDSQVKLYRNTLKMPALILDKKEKMISNFISSNGLVEDPCAVEKERAMINPWTSEEKEIFINKLATFGKDFRKIASFLDHKTTADCIEFYYKAHKSDCFEKTKKPEHAKQAKSYSTNSYLVTSGKRWNREMNAASLDMLGAASAIAANADDGIEIQQKCTARFLGMSGDYKTPRGDDGIVERSSSLDVCGSERETVAADVLAGICGSLSSEAMSSCITSSFDPGEGYQEWKCQKVGSLKRRPLTPEVTQEVDDETCSGESCGEMDPAADWTDEEKSIFIQAVSSYGKDFAMISRCVRTRSRDQCKVFFSKARKCLGLDLIRPGPCNEGMAVSDDANGGGSDAEDACVVETGSVVCSDKSGSKMDEDLPSSDLNINHEESDDPLGTMNLQTDMNRSDENNETGQWDCKDPALRSENVVTDGCQVEGKPELDFDNDCNLENAVEGRAVTVEAHKNAVSPSDTEAGRDEANGDFLGESVSAEGGNDHCLSTSGAEVETRVVGEVSAERLRTELEGQQVLPENNLNSKADENSDSKRSDQSVSDCAMPDSNTSGSACHLAADTDSSSGFAVNPKHQHEIALELDPTQMPHVISLQPDNFAASANLMPLDSAAIQYEKTLDQDTTFDFGRIRDEQCRKSASADNNHQNLSVHSLLDRVESSQILRGIPLQVSTKNELNGDISCKKPASLQSLSKLDRNFHSDGYLSQDCFLQKCNSSKAHSMGAELSFMAQEQTRDHLRSDLRSLSDVEKPCRNGDVKLFGQILTHPSSQPKPNSTTHENEDKGVHHPKLSSKSFNLKFTGSHNIDGNFAPAKLDRNNFLGLENLPMSYGFWDGSRIQTGFPSLPDSAILLAKYPAAFGNYPTPASKVEQQPLHSIVNGNEHNLNGVSVFPTREISSSNGVADYQVYRNRDGTKVQQPFTVDMKQRQDIVFSEIQRRNGYEAVSSIQQQGRGVVGINVVGRGGILVGGACNGVSDPVAAIKMHYAKAEQYSGQAGSIIREEESWRGKGDIGR